MNGSKILKIKWLAVSSSTTSISPLSTIKRTCSVAILGKPTPIADTLRFILEVKLDSFHFSLSLYSAGHTCHMMYIFL